MGGASLAKIDNFKNVINDTSFRNQVKTVLKENAGGFVVSMLDLYSNDTFLQDCNPDEVARECLKAAVLNLPLVKSLGFAYVVPFKKKPTFVIGYKGLVQLAQRTGQYKCINADVVYEGELLGFDKLTGEINLTGERTGDKIIGYFAYIRLISGFEKVLYMTRQEVEAWAKKYSPAYGSNYTPWKTEFDKMAQKTVLRRLISTYGAMTTDLFAALGNDDKGVTAVQEIKDKANRGQTVGFDQPIDGEYKEVPDTNALVDADGEIIEGDLPEQQPLGDDF